MLKVSELYIYPIKSLGGIFLNEAKLTDRGFQYDRCWMLVDKNNCFLTQRELPGMALLQVQLATEGLQVHHKKQPGEILFIPFQSQSTEKLIVKVFDDICHAQAVSAEADKWFSNMLSFDCRLVFMPETTHRKVDSRYAGNEEITSFTDGYPLLMIGQSSLDDLNGRLEESLPINRFRPNIVFTGGLPYEEDTMEHFTINEINFFGVKLSARCMITTTNQADASRGKEPLKTLATYRTRDKNVYFGQNLLFKGEGEIRLNDVIEIITKKRSLLDEEDSL
ncbi:MAG: MOSC N-terminal beta barrel domain-containing protein [Chitinophagaceae bacterium]